MLVNSVFAFLVPVAAQQGGWVWLCVVRLIQGLGEGPIVSHYGKVSGRMILINYSTNDFPNRCHVHMHCLLNGFLPMVNLLFDELLLWEMA